MEKEKKKETNQTATTVNHPLSDSRALINTGSPGYKGVRSKFSFF